MTARQGVLCQRARAAFRDAERRAAAAGTAAASALEFATARC